ncbi:MAG: DUF4129 domain-containing protein [Bacteroidota bacterium]
MPKLLFYLLLLSSFLLGNGRCLVAQDYGEDGDYGEIYPREVYYQSEQNRRNFSEDQWRETIEGLDYSRQVRGERQEDENFFTDGNTNRGTDRRYEEQNRGGTSAVWATIFKFLAIAIAVGVMALLIARVLGPEGLGKPRSRRFATELGTIDVEQIEENIHESDLERYIHQAIAQGDYRLAARLYYLAIIKELSLHEAIQWKRDKTNRDYLRELVGHPLRDEFRALTLVFERIWYGDRALEEADFPLLQARFEQLLQATKKTTAPTAR